MIAMMIFIHLIMLLIIGFGVGYWLLVTANKHEGRLKTLGESLGFVLIALVILYSILGFFYSMNIKDSDYMPGIEKQKTQMLDKEENAENENIQNEDKGPIMDSENNPIMDNGKNEGNEEMQEGPKEEESKPTKY